MAITFDKLKELLTPDGNKQISLAASALETPAVSALWELALYASAGILKIDQATMQADDALQKVTVSGLIPKDVLTGVTGAQLTTGEFAWLADGTINAKLVIAVTDAGWSLSSLYPILAGSLIGSVTLTASVITVDSTSPVVLPADFRSSFDYPEEIKYVADSLITGVSFDATMTVSDALKTIIGTAITLPVAVSGPISLWHFKGDDYMPEAVYPELLLDISNGGANYELDGNKFVFNLQTAVIFQELEADKKSDGLFADAEKVYAVTPLAVMAIRCHFTPKGWDSILLSMYIYGDENTSIRAEVGSRFAALPGTKDGAASLANGADVAAILNPPSDTFPIFDTVALTYAGVDLTLNPLSFTSIIFAFTITAKPWELFDGLIVIDNIGFTIQADNSDNDWTALGAIYAKARFYPESNENIILSAYVTVPDLAFSIELDIAGEMDLLGPVKKLVGDSIPMPTITGATFQVSGNVKEGTYAFNAEIVENWHLIGGDNGLVLTGMTLALATSIKTKIIQGQVTGTFTLGGVGILVSAAYDTTGGWVFTGQTAGGQAPSITTLLADIGNYFGFEIPAGFPEIDLSELSIEYSVKEQRMVIDAALSFEGAIINLTDLPLVGKYLDPDDSISLTSVSLNIDTKGSSTLTISLMLGKKAQDIVITFGGSKKQAFIQAQQVPGLSIYSQDGSLLALPNSAPGVDAGSQAGTWINVQKTFGPVSVERIGFALVDSKLAVMFDASLSFTAFNASVMGLGILIPLKSPYVPGFNIDGLAISYTTPSLVIAGAFLKTSKKEYDEYAGELMVRFGNFGLTALGAYATTDPPSLFAFVMINAPIGGPPYFYLNGLSAGFGYNRDLILLPIDKVASFPLVAGASPAGNPFGTHPSLADSMKVMEQYLGVSIGQNWVAAGVSVSSFGMVSVYALLNVAFGTRFQLGLLGLGTLQVPAAVSEPVVFAQLAMEALFIPDEGIIAVYAQLTADSYVLAKSCHLTGGFAFCLWFSPNDHNGDFVITFGGYNPYYTPPKYYPTVPRLGMNWTVSTELIIKGGMYFALTPHAIMVGGRLDAAWKSGPISVAFMAHTDFLIMWKPFHYDIRLGISFSVNASIDLAFVRITLSVSVGAELHIWGPSFYFRATIDLDIISFTIGDDDSNTTPPGIEWTDFRDSFLDQGGEKEAPAISAASFLQRPVGRRNRQAQNQLKTIAIIDDKPCTAAVNNLTTKESPVVRAIISNGVLQDLTSANASIKVHPDPNDPSKTVEVPIDYIVDPQHFSLRTQALVAGKTLSYNGKDSTGTWDNNGNTYTWKTDFGIWPMQLLPDDLQSTHKVTVCRLTDCMLYDGFSATPYIDKAPKAMWLYDSKLAANLNDKSLLEDIMQGLDLVPAIVVPDHSLPISVDVLETEKEGEVDTQWGTNSAPTTDPFGKLDPNLTFAATIGDKAVAQKRSAILTDLYLNNFNIKAALNVEPLQDVQTLQLLSPIVLAYLGESKNYN